MNEQTAIETQNGEITELTAPADFGKGMTFIDPSQMPDLETAEVGFNIQPEYMEFVKPGDSIRGVFNGISEITTKDKMNPGKYKNIPAVVLQTKTGIKLNAGASLVNQFRNLQPGVAVQVTYKGKEDTKSGNEVKTYDVHILKVPRANVPALPAAPAPVKADEPKFTNTHRATEYWSLVYSPKWKFSEDEGKAHLASCGNDFAAAISALNDPQF